MALGLEAWCGELGLRGWCWDLAKSLSAGNEIKGAMKETISRGLRFSDFAIEINPPSWVLPFFVLYMNTA
jgi:hypothetical protein